MSKIAINPDRIAEGVRANIEAQSRARKKDGPSFGGSPLAGTVYSGPKDNDAPCAVCTHKVSSRISAIAECSHVDCPHRGRCWVGGTPVVWHPKPKQPDPIGALFDPVSD